MQVFDNDAPHAHTCHALHEIAMKNNYIPNTEYTQKYRDILHTYYSTTHAYMLYYNIIFVFNVFQINKIYQSLIFTNNKK